MAATVLLCNRRDGKSSKIRMSDVNFKNKVKDFRCKASRLLDLPVHEIELIYCGHKFVDEQNLEFYGLQPGSIVHVLRKTSGEEQEEIPEPMDSASIQQVVTALQAALMNSSHRNSIEAMMSRPDTIENLVAATPGLGKDPVAIAMLQDSTLLAILADPDHIHKVIEAHPSLGHAAMMVAVAINEENSKGTTESDGMSAGTYSLDQMSDDDEMEPVFRGTPQQITSTQLAAALAAAGEGFGGGTQPSQESSSGSSGSGMITSDFLRQAMLNATGSSPGGSTSTGSAEQSNVSDVALQQLRDMGITDEARARHALQMTSGDIQAALELLFGDNDI